MGINCVKIWSMFSRIEMFELIIPMFKSFVLQLFCGVYILDGSLLGEKTITLHLSGLNRNLHWLAYSFTITSAMKQ